MKPGDVVVITRVPTEEEPVENDIVVVTGSKNMPQVHGALGRVSYQGRGSNYQGNGRWIVEVGDWMNDQHTRFVICRKDEIEVIDHLEPDMKDPVKDDIVVITGCQKPRYYPDAGVHDWSIEAPIGELGIVKGPTDKGTWAIELGNTWNSTVWFDVADFEIIDHLEPDEPESGKTPLFTEANRSAIMAPQEIAEFLKGGRPLIAIDMSASMEVKALQEQLRGYVGVLSGQWGALLFSSNGEYLVPWKRIAAVLDTAGGQESADFNTVVERVKRLNREAAGHWGPPIDRILLFSDGMMPNLKSSKDLKVMIIKPDNSIVKTWADDYPVPHTDTFSTFEKPNANRPPKDFKEAYFSSKDEEPETLHGGEEWPEDEGSKGIIIIKGRRYKMFVNSVKAQIKICCAECGHNEKIIDLEKLVEEI